MKIPVTNWHFSFKTYFLRFVTAYWIIKSMNCINNQKNYKSTDAR